MNNSSVSEASDDDFCVSELCYSYVDIIVNICGNFLGGGYLALGVTGRLLLLWIMLTRTTSRKSYQMVLIVSEVCADFTKVIYLLGWYLLWEYHWYRRCYWMMWYTVALSTIVMSTLMHHTVLMAFAVAADRLFALTRPISYKLFNHDRFRVVLVVASLATAFLVNVFEIFRYVVVQDDVGYNYADNESFVNSQLGIVLQHVRDTFLLLCTLLLTVTNGALIRAYRKFRRAAIKLKGDEEKKRQIEKLLLLLAIVQGCSFIVTTSSSVCFSVLEYSSFASCACKMEAAGEISDGIMFLTDTLNVLACLAINRSVQHLCLKTIRCSTWSASPSPAVTNAHSAKVNVKPTSPECKRR